MREIELTTQFTRQESSAPPTPILSSVLEPIQLQLEPRTRLSLDGAWDFFPDPQQQFESSALENVPPREIQVPAPWQAQFDDLREYSGVAWYRRRFQLPPAPAAAALDRTYMLHFGAVDYHASVWLNGTLIGEHEGGYLPFEFALDRALERMGMNELVVRVVDPGDEVERYPEFVFSEIPHGKQSWYGPLSGIWQSVYLEIRHSTFLHQLHITPDVANERAQVEILLNQPAPRELSLVLTLTDPSHQVTAHRFDLAKDKQLVELSLPIRNPLLWDTTSPDLYRVRVSLVEAKDEKLELDSLASNFGMRTIDASPDGHLRLNGRVLYLRGALDQDYYPQLIYTPFSDQELDQQFAQAKHMGLNCLRTHIKITDPRYYDAADRAGILIWTELPNWDRLTSKVKRRARETITGMVARDWNHPSIVIWTIVNEGWGVDLAANSDHRAWLAETYDFLKQLDPHRLVVGNSACFSNFHVVTDIEDFHNYYSIPDHYEKWRDWVEKFAARPQWTFAHAYQNNKAWREFMKDPWSTEPRVAAPEVRRRGTEPIVVSEFGNWGLPDVAKLRECYDGKDPWWFESGTEWGEGAAYPHGVEHRFKTWHLDKVFPTLSDLARASQRMQFNALKYQIEQMRLHPSIVGYIITEFTDVHWESNGLLDMCRNPKAYYDVIHEINGADVILPQWERVTFGEGEKCTVPLLLSHFSDAHLRDCRLEWSLDRWHEIHGVLEHLNLERARLSEIGQVSFEVPPLEDSVRVRLEFRLFNAIGEVITTNHHELYFFPRWVGQAVPARISAPPELADDLRALGYDVVEQLAEAELAIVEEMTDDLRMYVQNGGRVLWLAESTDSRQTYLGNLEIVEREGHRWEGDWASNMNWIRHDHLFGSIPTGGTVDFAFVDLTPEHVITGFSPRDFASSVHAGLFVGWLHHVVALIAEEPLGNGLLLVSTFRLREHLKTHLLARIMLRDMVAHLATTKTS